MKTMKQFALLIIGMAASYATAQYPPCFFQTAHNANGALYVDNSTTHDNVHLGSAFGTQLSATYNSGSLQGYGDGGTLAIGPAFYVTNPCVLDHVAFMTADTSHLDLYHNHFVCSGGTYSNQGDTVAATPATAGGLCTGGSDVQRTNTYDLGVYCEGAPATGPGCTPGKNYGSLGPIAYSTFYSVGQHNIASFALKQGRVLLQPGVYGVLMGGNCDDGSVPGTTSGVGQVSCGELAGEAAATDTSSPSGAWNASQEEFYPHKDFDWPPGSSLAHVTHCLLYDPLHDNSIGLPSTYTDYDGGGCTGVNSGSYWPNLSTSASSGNNGSNMTNVAPHAAHVVFMGTPLNTVYITTDGNPSGNCQTNVQTPAFFNTSSNWGNGSGQIGPGTTVLICGTFTGTGGANEFTFQGSGTSDLPILLKFDTGADLVSPYWSSTQGAIYCNGKSYITVDGNSTGIIENSGNGTQLTNAQSSYGVVFTDCTHSQVKNLTIRNIYINNGSSPSITSCSDQGGQACNGWNTADILSNHNSTGDLFTGNTLSQATDGILLSGDNNGDLTDAAITYNTISDTDHDIEAGGDSLITVPNLVIDHNDISNWTNWQYPCCAGPTQYHTDGIILYSYDTPTAATLVATISNNYIHGDLGTGSPTGFIYCAQNASCTVYNNLLVNTGHVINGIMWLDSHLCANKVYQNTIAALPGVNDIAVTLGNSPCDTVTPAGLVFENNVITGLTGGAATGIHDYQTLTADVAVSNHNVWQGSPKMSTNDQCFINYSGAGITCSKDSVTYPSWLSDGFDANSQTATANLNGSYIPQPTSSAIGVGANLFSTLAALNVDYFGNLRGGGSCTPVLHTTNCWDAGYAMYYVAPTGNSFTQQGTFTESGTFVKQ